MVAAGKAANAAGIPVVLDPVGAGATRYRTDTARRILSEVDVTVLRGNQGEVATLVGVAAEVRGVESIGAAGEPASSRERPVASSASSRRSPAWSTTSRTASACFRRERSRAARAVTGTGCMSSAITGCFLAAKRDEPLEAAAEALAAFGVAGEDAARRAKGPGVVPRRALRRARSARSATLDERARISEAARVVADLETARIAVEAGATVVQWRLKEVPRVDVVERGRATRSLCARPA